MSEKGRGSQSFQQLRVLKKLGLSSLSMSASLIQYYLLVMTMNLSFFEGQLVWFSYLDWAGVQGTKSQSIILKPL